MNSRAKGKRGELEAAAEIVRVFGVDARRGCQFKGGPGSPDVVGLDGVHVEVKRTEALRIYEAVAQATRDAGKSIPLVMHRRSRGGWLAILRFDDLPWLARTLCDACVKE